MRESGARRGKDRDENVQQARKQMVLALFGAFRREIMDYGKIFCPHVQAHTNHTPQNTQTTPKIKIYNLYLMYGSY